MGLLNSTLGMVYEIKGDTSDVESKLSALDSKVSGTASGFDQGAFAATAFGSAIGNIATTAISTLSSTLIDGVKYLTDYSSRMEQTQIAFETLMGNAQLAAKHLKDLQNFAAETPFEFESLSKMSQRLQAVGVAADKVIPLMRDIGNVTAATGEISSDRVEGITTAITQMISKTKVSAEEMEQLAERGVPAWKILADATGKTQSEVRKFAEQGVISSEIMVEALQKISQQKFGDAMQKQSQTFSGAWSTIKDIATQEGGSIFQPVYDAISKFTVNFANSLQSQEANTKEVGNKWAFAIGESMGKSYREGWFGKVQKSIADFYMFGGSELGTGLRKGFEKSSSTLAQITSAADLSKLQYPILSTADLRIADDTFKSISSTIGDIDAKLKNATSLDKALEAEKAKKDAETLKKMIEDLTSQVAFYGQTSEEAAIKQKLIQAGITDFTSELAKEAIELARTLDKLKEMEERAKKLNDLQKQISEFRSNAVFEIAFPKATELDKFEAWVKRNANGFKELNKEIIATRALLSQKLSLENVAKYLEFAKDARELQKSFRDIFDTEIRDTRFESAGGFIDKMSAFAEKLLQAKNVKIATTLEDALGVNSFPEAFATKISGLVEQISKLRNAGLDASGFVAQLGQYLTNLGEIVDENNTKFRIFGEEGVKSVIEKLLALNEVVKQSEIKKRIAELDKVFEDFGLTIGEFGAKTEAQKFLDWLANPDVTTAIEQRAKAIGMTAEELKNLLIQLNQNQETKTERPRIVGEKKEEGFDWLGSIFSEESRAAITDGAEFMKSVFSDLQTMVGGAIGSMIDGLANLLTQWIVTGKFSARAALQMAAGVAAGLAVQAGIKAIFELAEGYAALANPFLAWTAPFHFAAAKTYGIVAGVALAAGVGLGALSRVGTDRSAATSAFSNQTGTATSSRSTGGAYSSYGDDASTINIGRNAPAGFLEALREPIRIELGLKPNDAYILDTVQSNVERNGRMRRVILDVASS